MKHLSLHPILALIAFCMAATGGLHGEEVLFIGNSYTSGGPNAEINKHGGIPKLVEAVAASKGKTLSTMILAPGGKDWGFHLKQPVTDQTLRARKWDWVVLQDFSTQPTHIGDPGKFFQDGEIFYKEIREFSPQAGIVLYETWARAKGHEVYTGASTPKTFVNPVEMSGELQKNYTELYRKLEALETGDQLALAPVGLAFARCSEKYPGIKLNWTDRNHSSIQGGYLTALVIYATIFHDSPKGATREFFGITLDAVEAAKLQEIAAGITSQGHSAVAVESNPQGGRK